MNTNQILEIAQNVAKRVGDEIKVKRDSGADFEMNFKQAKDPVTEFDIWSEKEITKTVKENFPDHVIIGEETASELKNKTGKTLKEIASENVCWIVDPIDGTSNFGNNIPLFNVSIGIYDKGQALVGIVYDPSRQEMFTAVSGEGARLNGSPISCSKKTELSKAILSSNHNRRISEDKKKVMELYEAIMTAGQSSRSLGSAALEISWVACGRLDGFFQNYIFPWDFAACTLIAKEAGCRLGHLFNPEETNYSIFREDIIVASPKIYAGIEEIVKQTYKN